jgi:hypothetical protein
MTGEVKINLAQFVEHQKKLGKMFKQVVMKGIHDGARRCIPILHQATEAAPPASIGGRVGAFDTGRYKMAWKVRATATGAEIYNDMVYASVIEHGRRVGAQMPNITDIEKWVRRKLYAEPPKGALGPRLGRGRRATMSKSAAFPIARAIQRRGLKGRKVLTNVLPQLEQIVNKSVAKYIDTILTWSGISK